MILFISMLIPIFVKNKVSIMIDESHSFYKKQQSTFYLNVKNNSLLPITKLQFHVQIKNVLIDEQTDEDFFIALDGKSIISVPIDIKSNSIGKILINVSSFSVYDYFGNFRTHKQINKQSELYILPEPYHLNFARKDLLVGNSEFIHISGEEKGFNIYDIIGFKEYEIGDNLKQIHWKISSKIDELIVKEMSKPKEKSYFVLLEPALKGNNPKEINMLVEMFYSLSNLLLESGQTHTIGWFDHEQNDIRVKEIYSLKQLNNSLRELLVIDFNHSGSKSLESFIRSKHYVKTSNLIYIKSIHITTNQIDNLHHIDVTTIQCSSDKATAHTSSDDQSVVFTSESMEES